MAEAQFSEAWRDNGNTSVEDSDVIDDLWNASNQDESPLEKSIIEEEIKGLDQSGAKNLRDDEILSLSDDEIKAISDVNAQEVIRNKRKELIRTKYKDSSTEAIISLSEDEVKGITEEQIAAIANPQAKEALINRKKDIERRKYEDKTVDEIRDLSSEEISTITPEQINAIKNNEAKKAVKDRKKEIERTKYKDKNVDDITALKDAQIVAITEEQIAAITDKNAQEAVRKRKIEIDAKQKAVGFRSIGGPTEEGGVTKYLTPEGVTDKIQEQLEKILNSTDLNISPAVRAALKKQAELRTRRLQEERNLRPDQDALDQKEIDMQKTIENRKRLEIFFRDSKFFLGGAMIGASLAMLLSGNVDVSTILLGAAAGGIVGGVSGMAFDKNFSIDRKKIETEMLRARLEAKKKEGVKTQREEAALRRETNASIAFSQKAAELYARISGLTDPKQVAQYTQTFMNSLDYQMLTAIG